MIKLALRKKLTPAEQSSRAASRAEQQRRTAEQNSRAKQQNRAEKQQSRAEWSTAEHSRSQQTIYQSISDHSKGYQTVCTYPSSTAVFNTVLNFNGFFHAAIEIP